MTMRLIDRIARWFKRPAHDADGGGAARTPALFVIAAPSGAGKTSLVKALVRETSDLVVSISYTTRTRRESEVDGEDYFFIDKPTFEAMRDNGEFLESADVFDNCYGTARSTVDAALADGHSVVLEIDWQGARQVRSAMPDCQTIFILPPSRAELEKRLRHRRTDTDEVIARRLRDSVSDMSHWDEFDYVVVNDDFDAAVADLMAVVRGRGEKARATRPELGPLLADLLAD